jgi:membrane-associated protease RseP (regulator of RpoE activity)
MTETFALLLAIAIHESGHYFAAKFLGVRTWGLYVGWRGVGVRLDNSIAKDPQRWLEIAATGPLANVVAIVALVWLQIHGHTTPVAFVLWQIGVFLSSMASDGVRVGKLLFLLRSPQPIAPGQLFVR